MAYNPNARESDACMESNRLWTIVLPAKADFWQSLSYVACWNGEPGSFDSYGWLRDERRACHNKVITRPTGLKVPVWQLWVVSIATDCKQWPWLGFGRNRTSLVALWLDTFILCLTSSIFRFSLAHLFRDHLWVELLYTLDQGRPNYGPRALYGPPTPFLWPASADWFYCHFLVWFLISKLVNYEWGFTNIIPSKLTAKQYLRNIR